MYARTHSALHGCAIQGDNMVFVYHYSFVVHSQHPKLLELLTAHVGIPSSNSKLCELYQSWYEDRPVGVDHAVFWSEMVPCRGNYVQDTLL